MRPSVLIVDDEPAIRMMLATQVSFLGYDGETAQDGNEALGRLERPPRPEIVLSDVEMPGLSGLDLLRRLKRLDRTLQVVMISGRNDVDMVRECLREGAYDYLAKPFEIEDLANTLRRALERRKLLVENEIYQSSLERMVREQTEEIRETRDIALLTLAKLAESRDPETGLHLDRIAEYSRHLAEGLRDGPYASEVTDEFVDHLHKSSPLHDIGKVGIPDAILLKPAPLTPNELLFMRRHTTIGGDTLRSVIEKFSGRSFLHMAMEICYSHHERWDGSGYPAGTGGTAIPLPARVVALADAYDAITSARPYKPPLPHEEAMRRITLDRARHFDPVLVDSLLQSHEAFIEIARRLRQSARTRER